MTTGALLADLQRQGFILRPLPDGKLFVSPASKLTAILRAEIRQRKNELLTMLVSNRPYINARGELIIPFDSEAKYRWWAGGQSITKTLAELDAPPDVWRRYVAGYSERLQ